MNNFFLIILALIGLYLFLKLLKRLLYTLVRTNQYALLSGECNISLIDAGFLPVFSFSDGAFLYFTSEDGKETHIHRFNGNNFEKIFTLSSKLNTAPLAYEDKLILSYDGKLALYKSKELQWQINILKSRISSRNIKPIVRDGFLFFPESDLLVNKRRGKSNISQENLPSVKKIDARDGRLDLSLPLSYSKSRYGMIGGCDTNIIADGDYFYIGLQTGFLAKIESKTFMVAWMLNLPSTAQSTYTKRSDFDFDPIIDDKYVYIGYSGLLLQIDKESSQIRNKLPYYQSICSMVIDSSYGYFSSFGHIYRLDKDNFKTERFFLVSKKYIRIRALDDNIIALLATDRKPYAKGLVSRYDGYFYIIRTKDSKEMLRLRIHNISNPMLIKDDKDNRFIVFNENKQALIIKPSEI